MRDIGEHLDLGSRIVIVVTFALFAAAAWAKGLGHDLLLEAGVFLVSVKLILMAYKNSVADRRIDERLGRIEALLRHEDPTEGSGGRQDKGGR